MPFGHHHLHAAFTRHRAFAAELFQRFDKTAVVAIGFDFDKAQVGFALLFEVRVMDDAALAAG